MLKETIRDANGSGRKRKSEIARERERENENRKRTTYEIYKMKRKTRPTLYILII